MARARSARLLPRLTRPAFRRRAPATAQVLADWAAIVGPAIAAVTTPRRLSSGTLTIACAGPIAMELQHLAGEVMARINTHLGSQVVTACASCRHLELLAPLAPPAPPVADPAKLAAAVDAAVADLPEGELRGALASLGRAIADQRPEHVRGPHDTDPPLHPVPRRRCRRRWRGYLGWRNFMPVAAGRPAPPSAGIRPTPAGDQRKTERALGDPAAKVTVPEFFSLTCTHCAAFAQRDHAADGEGR